MSEKPAPPPNERPYVDVDTTDEFLDAPSIVYEDGTTARSRFAERHGPAKPAPVVEPPES